MEIMRGGDAVGSGDQLFDAGLLLFTTFRVADGQGKRAGA